MLLLLITLCSAVLEIQTRSTGFYLLDENKEYTNNGLLIADKINGHQIGSVCDDNFDENAAAVICREMKFNFSVGFESGVSSPYFSWTMKKEFKIVLDDVTCDAPDIPFSSCSIVSEHDCDRRDEQVFLECGCSNDSYIRPNYQGCGLCPPGTVVSNEDPMVCVCGPGTEWENEQCAECPENSYKPSTDNTPCTPCPPHSSSGSGAHTCNCDAGWYWNNGVCVRCVDNTVSSSGSTECISCPSGSGPVHGNTACGCAAGLHWNNTHCTVCPANTYSTQDSTVCSQCPENTVSESGSAHCDTCKPGHVWSNYTCLNCADTDHENCAKCPPGYTITPGNLCVEEKSPDPDAEEQKAAPTNVSTIILAVCLVVLFAFLVILALLLYKSRRRRSPPKTAAPAMPYSLVQEAETYDYEEPEYECPQSHRQNAIYEQPKTTPQYVEPEDPMYVRSDRGEENGDCAYVTADSAAAGYSAFCGNGEGSARDNFTDNIYDNI